ncbi:MULTISPECIES: hypothetical protein [unclassified Solwaraspora]|uniref:hypothetical protein n=1 Tax=unclassified Solwaraspora TaxID=2627926 RepID=UPI00259BAD88|nr:hypothetical protein [Solwaraspora sp. WMMA2056]WJK42816.1 hypothetical protein O7608_10765 [Solwaraspora sp. WMMA2056]
MSRQHDVTVDPPHGAVADQPQPVGQDSGNLGRKLVVLAVGGMLVGLAITVAVDREQPTASSSWVSTILLLLAVVIAAGAGSLITRTVAVTGQRAQRAAVELGQASHTLDDARREVEAATVDGAAPTVQAEVDAVARRLDGLNEELTALRRSGNRTAWATFLLGTLLGVVTQVTLG